MKNDMAIQFEGLLLDFSHRLTVFCDMLLKNLYKLIDRLEPNAEKDEGMAKSLSKELEGYFKVVRLDMVALFRKETDYFDRKMSPGNLQLHLTRFGTSLKKLYRARCSFSIMNRIHRMYNARVMMKTGIPLELHYEFAKLDKHILELSSGRKEVGDVLHIYNVMLSDMHKIFDSFETKRVNSCLYDPECLQELVGLVRYHFDALVEYNSTLFYDSARRSDHSAFRTEVNIQALSMCTMIERLLKELSHRESGPTFLKFMKETYEEVSSMFKSKMPELKPCMFKPNKGLEF